MKAANDNAAQALLTTNAGLTARFDAASGASSLQVALETFDAQAQQQLVEEALIKYLYS